MLNQFSRTVLMIGEEGLEKLQDSKVIVFGVGGVGGYVVEALARSGVGRIDVVDNDKVCITNINRQILATHKTIGKYKTDVAEERILEINPKVKIDKYNIFFTPDKVNEFDFSKYDYIVDAIDTVVGKLTLAEYADKLGIPIISAMGAGNKMNPTGFEVSDIYKTSVCPLARVMRQELRKRKIKKLKVVYSKEIPITSKNSCENTNGKSIPGSIAFVPSVVGLIIAGEVIKDLIKNTKK